jgi:Zn ribbon nucleic-acid-binding protein
MSNLDAPAYCDKCTHICHKTYWSEGSIEGGVRFERCFHCGRLLEDATPEQIAAEVKTGEEGVDTEQLDTLNCNQTNDH